MEIWVAIDVDNMFIIKAFYGENAEEAAVECADNYYFTTGNDSTIRRTYLKNVD